MFLPLVLWNFSKKDKNILNKAKKIKKIKKIIKITVS